MERNEYCATQKRQESMDSLLSTCHLKKPLDFEIFVPREGLHVHKPFESPSLTGVCDLQSLLHTTYRTSNL